MKGPVREVRLWDPLLRGFHWLLAFFVILDGASASSGLPR